jgi:hypothetical protein
MVNATLNSPNNTCATAFTIGGHSFDLGELQVQVGGFIAANSVDSMSYCLNVCATVTSDRNCVCYPCGGSTYPSQQISNSDNR